MKVISGTVLSLALQAYAVVIALGVSTSPDQGILLCENNEADNVGMATSNLLEIGDDARKVKINLKKFDPREHASTGPESSSTRSSEKRYLSRLRKYRPPRHITTGISTIDFPLSKNPINSKHIKRLPIKPRKSKRHHRQSSSSPQSKKERGCKKRPQKKRESSSSDKKGCRKRPQKKKKVSSSSDKKACKKKCHKKKRSPVLRSKSSSSSHSRSFSLSISFSQEDVALLGSCDQPAVAFHHRHFSKHAHLSEGSRSRSRTRTTII